MYFITFLSFLFAVVVGASPQAELKRDPSLVCTVPASGSEAIDDTPAVVDAFKRCGHGGRIIFENTTYHIHSVMNTTGLQDCEVDLYGTLLWSTNISYWLNHSLPVGYQNQSTAWLLGGRNVRFNGYGYGTFNGNGQAWYDSVGSVSNYPRRPHALTISGTSDSEFTGLRFLQSQMWTLSIIHTHRTLFDHIYVNSTSSGGSSRNTDGADTIYSSHITFRNWEVDNGDDSISVKANSTDILIEDSLFHRGLGIAIGSIGQYKDVYEIVERVTVRNITYSKTLHAVYFKTWTGEQVNYPPNGGGGGLGHASDMTFQDLRSTALRGPAIAVSQCTTFSGTAGNCTSSKFELSALYFQNLRGTTTSADVASLQCSAVKPCKDIRITEVDLVLSNGTQAEDYLCGNVEDTRGFNCTGEVCVGGSATGGC
ncbi:hypothetical protein N7462_000031 [Penicillium macrosclerotiorum]|uniref:uncharacterized protein n=1 Tax=Penicillium macrosclerotiorum TaxID=303699 RepID=UPI00254920CF|nr:uncharacterized protein N7462_000031 [Penicillium macrosclerotiorum]KAJ5698026.1 hypothetical protein N7462_000031 [Penicillium macrosclerotiorum]